MSNNKLTLFLDVWTYVLLIANYVQKNIEIRFFSVRNTDIGHIHIWMKYNIHIEAIVWTFFYEIFYMSIIFYFTRKFAKIQWI